MNVLTRREFALSIATMVGAVGHRSVGPLRVGLLLGSANKGTPDAAAGVRLALAENERSASLFGRRIDLLEKSIDSLSTRDVQRLIRDRGLNVVIGGMSLAEARTLEAAAYDKLFINIGATDDRLRREECLRPMYNVAASDAMIASAAASVGSTGAGSVELWHSSLERYGAAQLNDRFRARFSRPMSSPAWAGWFAMKLIWEAALRAPSYDSAGFTGTLDKDETQFDGHKGAPLSFRSWDHQLRQPLYIVQGGRVVAEVPDVARNSEQPMREQLDKFGDTESSTHCAFERG